MDSSKADHSDANSEDEEEPNVLEECIQLRIDEMDVLRSMFSEDELIFNTSSARDGECLKHASGFSIRLTISDVQVEISFQTPADYPVLEVPSVFVRTNGRWNDGLCTTEVRKFIRTLPRAQPLVMEIIMWVQENGPDFLEEDRIGKPSEQQNSKPETYQRLYILSHHLYSYQKRMNIISLSKTLNLNGFSTPGKPAVIVVEGESSSCQSFWSDLKTWSWKKISLQYTDNFVSASDLKLETFRELKAQTSDVKKIFSDAGLDDKFNILYNI